MSGIGLKVRAEFQKGDDIRDAGLTTPDFVERTDDILYGEDPKWQVLDLYRPKNRTGEKLPVIWSVSTAAAGYTAIRSAINITA